MADLRHVDLERSSLSSVRAQNFPEYQLKGYLRDPRPDGRSYQRPACRLIRAVMIGMLSPYELRKVTDRDREGRVTTAYFSW
jgi:hypothetical protein